MLFFTGARYTEQARRYADEMSIALFHYELDGLMEPANKAAEELIKDVRKAERKAAITAVRKDVRKAKRETASKEARNVPPRRVTHPYTHATGVWMFCLSVLLFLFQSMFPGIQGAVAVTAVAGALLGLVMVGVSSEEVLESATPVNKTDLGSPTPEQEDR